MYIVVDVRIARSGERTRYANLKVVRSLISLVGGLKMSYKNISAREFNGDMKGLLRVIFLDFCTGREFTVRLNFFVCHGCNVVRGRGGDGSRGWDGVGDATKPPLDSCP